MPDLPTAPKPAPLHVLACYVLHCMLGSLSQKEKADPQLNNRKKYVDILLLVCDWLRKNHFPCTLGVQIKFSKDLRLRWTPFTLQTVLRQCVAQEWLLEPGSGNNPYNYDLTEKGQAIVKAFVTDGGYAVSCNSSKQHVDAGPQHTSAD